MNDKLKEELIELMIYAGHYDDERTTGTTESAILAADDLMHLVFKTVRDIAEETGWYDELKEETF